MPTTQKQASKTTRHQWTQSDDPRSDDGMRQTRWASKFFTSFFGTDGLKKSSTKLNTTKKFTAQWWGLIFVTWFGDERWKSRGLDFGNWPSPSWQLNCFIVFRFCHFFFLGGGFGDKNAPMIRTRRANRSERPQKWQNKIRAHTLVWKIQKFWKSDHGNMRNSFFLSTTMWLRMGVKGDADLLMFSYSFSLSTRPKWHCWSPGMVPQPNVEIFKSNSWKTELDYCKMCAACFEEAAHLLLLSNSFSLPTHSNPHCWDPGMVPQPNVKIFKSNSWQIELDYCKRSAACFEHGGKELCCCFLIRFSCQLVQINIVDIWAWCPNPMLRFSSWVVER